MGDTALSIRVPEADALVRAGFPAHVTVLYPFLHESLIGAGERRELAGIFGDRDAFELEFREFRRWPGVLYLAPEPDDLVRGLTDAVRVRWPEVVPYRGVFGSGGLAPHLTVANSEGPATWRAAYDLVERELAPMLPVVSKVREVALIVWDGERWCEREAYPLRDLPAQNVPYE
ncbi:2'-5' RNA ligase family protein [Streptomyces sp. NBC_01465]|uniref:2'-5' RNA ligase family protein n=1 Tax=Streptomyces sp. NBC_01465 TaxID=2903878 RepID=UPI002E3352C3|nr:2'-5' RNA ligase family protein [Streptomyces sp. NBC_01465]